MIEFLLIFGFGLLVAILLVMLVTPAVYHRIVKLTEDRMRATVPLSATEVKGKLDMARAAYASNNAKLSAELSRQKDIATAARLETQQYQSELAAVAGSLQQAEQHIETLVNESGQLRSDIRKKDGAAETLSHQITELNQHRDAANRELTQMYNDLMGATTELENLRIDLAARDTETINLNAQIEAERDRRKEVEQDLAAARALAKETENKLDAEQDLHNEARINLSAALSSVYNIEEDVKRANAHITDLGKERDTAQSDERIARERVDALEAEISEWKRKWEGAQEEIRQTESRIEDLRSRIVDMETNHRLPAETELEDDKAEKPAPAIDGSIPAAVAGETTAPNAIPDAPEIDAVPAADAALDEPDALSAVDTSTEHTTDQERDRSVAALLEKLQTSVQTLTQESEETNTNSATGTDDLQDGVWTGMKIGVTDISDIQKRQNELVERLRQADGNAEQERLRGDLADLAARVVLLTARREGSASPVGDLLQTSQTSAESGDGCSRKNRRSLADRIFGGLEEQA